MKELRLERINDDNFYEVMNLKVSMAQKHFVATNTFSIVHAYLALINGKEAFPFGIFVGNKPVGFLMVGYDIFEDGKRYMNVKAIYTSPFYRCQETARLINKHLNVPIIEDERLNEFGSVHLAVKGLEDKEEKETWKECQERIMESIKDIVFKYDDKDTVICVTSGVNLTAFICAAYGIEPNSKLPFPLVPSCSPIGFEINKNNF